MQLMMLVNCCSPLLVSVTLLHLQTNDSDSEITLEGLLSENFCQCYKAIGHLREQAGKHLVCERAQSSRKDPGCTMSAQFQKSLNCFKTNKNTKKL